MANYCRLKILFSNRYINHRIVYLIASIEEPAPIKLKTIQSLLLLKRNVLRSYRAYDSVPS